MKNKVDLEKVYRERIREGLTETEQKAMEAALAAPLLSNEEINKLLVKPPVEARRYV